MPQATSACPAEVEPVCGSDVGPLQAVDQSAVEAAAVCGGGATRPSSATTRGARPSPGSTAIAGLCSIWAAEQRGELRREPGRPERRGRDEQHCGCPDDEHEHVRSWSHQGRGAGSGYVSIARCRGGERRAATIIRPMAADPAFAPVPAEPDHVGARARRARALGSRGDVRAVAREERRRADVLVHRRPDHGQQPDGHPPRLGAVAEGSLPALPRGAGRGSALPERLRLPGALGRGRGREVARAQLQARDRGLRARPLRARVPRPRGRVLERPDRAVEAARHVDGLGAVVLHDDRPQHQLHLGLPQDLPRARMALPGPSPHGLVPALRHVTVTARSHSYGFLPRHRGSVAVRALPLHRRARARRS